MTLGRLLMLFEVKSCAVDTISETCGSRSIIKHVTKMSSTPGAGHLQPIRDQHCNHEPIRDQNCNNMNQSEHSIDIPQFWSS